MPTIQQLEPSKKLRILLQGPPGAGKSCVAYQFPKAFVIDLDNNMNGPINWLKRNSRSLPAGYDKATLQLGPDNKWSKVPIAQHFSRLENLLVDADATDNLAYDSIVIDSATQLIPIFIAEILRRENKPKMGLQEWGAFAVLCRAFLASLMTCNKHVVLIAHEKSITSDSGAQIGVDVMWPGQMGEILGAFFTDVWRAEMVRRPGVQEDYDQIIRTRSDKYKLKSSLDLPGTFTFDWKLVESKL